MQDSSHQKAEFRVIQSDRIRIEESLSQDQDESKDLLSQAVDELFDDSIMDHFGQIQQLRFRSNPIEIGDQICFEYIKSNPQQQTFDENDRIGEAIIDGKEPTIPYVKSYTDENITSVNIPEKNSSKIIANPIDFAGIDYEHSYAAVNSHSNDFAKIIEKSNDDLVISDELKDAEILDGSQFLNLPPESPSGEINDNGYESMSSPESSNANEKTYSTYKNTIYEPMIDNFDENHNLIDSIFYSKEFNDDLDFINEEISQPSINDLMNFDCDFSDLFPEMF